LLAIIRMLKKWWANLLGKWIYMYTDHHTLDKFDTQKDLSWCQLRWQELISQYNMTISYIRGEDNTIVDALSRLPPNCFPEEQDILLCASMQYCLSQPTGPFSSKSRRDMKRTNFAKRSKIQKWKASAKSTAYGILETDC
jgi:hypothetical protein